MSKRAPAFCVRKYNFNIAFNIPEVHVDYECILCSFCQGYCVRNMRQTGTSCLLFLTIIVMFMTPYKYKHVNYTGRGGIPPNIIWGGSEKYPPVIKWSEVNCFKTFHYEFQYRRDEMMYRVSEILNRSMVIILCKKKKKKTVGPSEIWLFASFIFINQFFVNKIFKNSCKSQTT